LVFVDGIAGIPIGLALKVDQAVFGHLLNFVHVSRGGFKQLACRKML
jgi:hypothetical protein